MGGHPHHRAPLIDRGCLRRAKRLLASKSQEWTESDVEAESSRREEMIESSGRRTVPQIFICDRHLGASTIWRPWVRLASWMPCSGDGGSGHCRVVIVGGGPTGNTASIFAARGRFELHPVGYVGVEPGTTRTSVDGVLACGDASDPTYRQAATASGAGCTAAIDAER